MAHRILIVDDDPDILTIAGESLRADGFIVHTAATPAEASLEFVRAEPDLVLLDINMGDEPLAGHRLCREFTADREVPIVFLTARATDIDVVVGLELGADDYVTKPFSHRELTARVRAVLRRLKRGEQPARVAETQLGDLVLDEAKLRVAAAGGEADLTRHEFFILKALARDPGSVLSRQDLIEAVYGSDMDVAERTVDSHIRYLRDKLGGIGSQPIQTVRGVGYRLSLESAQK